MCSWCCSCCVRVHCHAETGLDQKGVLFCCVFSYLCQQFQDEPCIGVKVRCPRCEGQIECIFQVYARFHFKTFLASGHEEEIKHGMVVQQLMVVSNRSLDPLSRAGVTHSVQIFVISQCLQVSLTSPGSSNFLETEYILFMKPIKAGGLDKAQS